METLDNFFVKFPILNFINPLCGFRAVTCVKTDVQRAVISRDAARDAAGGAVVLVSQDAESMGGQDGGQLVLQIKKKYFLAQNVLNLTAK
jgi:hypothetical protein